MDHPNILRIASSVRLLDVNRLRSDCSRPVYVACNSILRELFLDRGNPRTMDLGEARATLAALQILAHNFEAAIVRNCGVHPFTSVTTERSSS